MGTGQEMQRLNFIDDSDLVEQEQDSIKRILHEDKAGSVEFPFAAGEVGATAVTTQDAACSPTALPDQPSTPIHSTPSSRQHSLSAAAPPYHARSRPNHAAQSRPPASNRHKRSPPFHPFLANQHFSAQPYAQHPSQTLRLFNPPVSAFLPHHPFTVPPPSLTASVPPIPFLAAQQVFAPAPAHLPWQPAVSAGHRALISPNTPFFPFFTTPAPATAAFHAQAQQRHSRPPAPVYSLQNELAGAYHPPVYLPNPVIPQYIPRGPSPSPQAPPQEFTPTPLTESQPTPLIPPRPSPLLATIVPPPLGAAHLTASLTSSLPSHSPPSPRSPQNPHRQPQAASPAKANPSPQENSSPSRHAKTLSQPELVEESATASHEAEPPSDCLTFGSLGPFNYTATDAVVFLTDDDAAFSPASLPSPTMPPILPNHCGSETEKNTEHEAAESREDPALDDVALEIKKEEQKKEDQHAEKEESDDLPMGSNEPEQEVKPEAEKKSEIPATKSWASLFHKGNETAEKKEHPPPFQKSVKKAVNATCDAPNNVESAKDETGRSGAESGVEDELAGALRATLSTMSLEHESKSPEVRGLANRGNWCYINAVMQALFACPPFFNLIRRLGAVVGQRRPQPSATPTLDALVALQREMMTPIGVGKGAKKAIEPVGMQELVYRLCPSDAAFKHGRQEDAQEFLLALLNALHDELVALFPPSPPSNNHASPHTSPDPDTISNSTTEGGADADDEGEEEDGDEWHQVGPGKRIAVTREADFTHSLLSQIFVGQLRYQISEAGAKDAVNLQPFFTLPLDIDAEMTTSVEAALASSLAKETIKRAASGSKMEVDAKKASYIGLLPPVLIFHLKYFTYSEKGMLKLLKPINFDVELTLGLKVLTPKAHFPQAQRTYKLFAVVFHHGEAAQGGHYTADVHAHGRWLDLNDESVTPVTHRHLGPSKDLPRRVPYLLFYRRADLIPPAPASTGNVKSSKR